jgi:Fe-S-cluster containining protein
MLQDYDDQLQRRAITLFAQEGEAYQKSLQAVRAGRSTALTHQVSVYRRMDDAFRAVDDPPGQTLACRSGCSYCCHYHVYVSTPEALAIAEHLQSAPAGLRVGYLERLRQNAALAGELGRDAHIGTNIACAFLSDSGVCAIYALRPSACRRHHSYDVTPCKTTFDDPSCTDQNPQSAARLATADGFQAAAMVMSRQEGFDERRYEMSGAILEALNNKASAKRWKDGKTAFPSVRDRADDDGLAG